MMISYLPQLGLLSRIHVKLFVELRLTYFQVVPANHANEKLCHNSLQGYTRNPLHFLADVYCLTCRFCLVFSKT